MVKSRLLKRRLGGEFAVQLNYHPPFGFRRGSVLWFRPKTEAGVKEGEIFVATIGEFNGYILGKLDPADPVLPYSFDNGHYNFEIPFSMCIKGVYFREAFGTEKEALMGEADEKDPPIVSPFPEIDFEPGAALRAQENV